MKKIKFWKMQGAGNDFILIEDRAGRFPASDPALLRNLCSRRLGIGSEGLILLQKSRQADFRMRFFNPDGREAEMCGNGARCAARLACELGLARKRMTIESKAGLLQAEIIADQVRVLMMPTTDWQLNQRLALGREKKKYHFVTVGVPHVVIECPDLYRVNVQKLGAQIRYHRKFKPAGTNVNFITVTNRHALKVRTYERGVEAETQACGTGATACALIAARLGRVTPPVRVTCAGGDILEVNFRLTPKSAERVTLLGPVKHVFEGMLEYSRK